MTDDPEGDILVCWTASCSGGMTAQLDNVLRRARADKLEPKE